MKRAELQVGEEYIVAPPAIDLAAPLTPAHVRRVVLVDPSPWEYDRNGIPRPVPKGTGTLVVERAPDGGPLRSVLPIGQYRMTAAEYDRLRAVVDAQVLAEGESRRSIEEAKRDEFDELCAYLALDGGAFGEYDGDTSEDRDGRHWFEPRREVVGMSFDTFRRLAGQNEST